MRYAVEAIAFPSASVRGAVVQNDDGSFSLYINAILPEDIRQGIESELVHHAEELAQSVQGVRRVTA